MVSEQTTVARSMAASASVVNKQLLYC